MFQNNIKDVISDSAICTQLLQSKPIEIYQFRFE